MSHNFFAAISRMKYIDRWALMRNSREENLCEHSMEVAMIAHALCVIGNIRYGRHLDAEKAAVVGLYHDSSEIITGDMPTPVKYYSQKIRDAYKQVGQEIAAGTFRYEGTLHHTHEGSIGNLCNEAICARMDAVMQGFDFEAVARSLRSLCE